MEAVWPHQREYPRQSGSLLPTHSSLLVHCVSGGNHFWKCPDLPTPLTEDFCTTPQASAALPAHSQVRILPAILIRSQNHLKITEFLPSPSIHSSRQCGELGSRFLLRASKFEPRPANPWFHAHSEQKSQLWSAGLGDLQNSGLICWGLGGGIGY